ncbi:hypothetical protein Tco_1372066 [Tanacetum coccineum]
MESLWELIQETAKHKREYDRRMNDRMMQSKEGNVDSSKALDAGLVVTESNETESERHVSSNRLGKDTHAKDADINFLNNKKPLAEVQLTVQHDTLANEQQHSVQSEPIYDTHLLEKVDRNTIPDSINMCHRGGKIEQNDEKCQVSCPLLDPSFDNMTTAFSNQSLESENIFIKKNIAQLQKDLLRMDAHCVNIELKYQNQALKDEQHGQILNETSNKAKIIKKIKVLEKINIQLEHSVAKLLAENEKLHKKNEHLKQTYKDLYDSIKTTRVQIKDHNDSLIAQINSKTVENADVKAQKRTDWDILFQPLFDELLTPPPSVDHPAPEVIALIPEVVSPEPAASTGSPSSTTVDQDAPSHSNSQTTPETQSPIIPNDVEEDNHDLDVAHMNNDLFFGITIPKNNSKASSSDVIPTIVHTATPNSEHINKWTKDL